MPIYEYLCEQCGSRSEVLQRMDEAPRTVCDECGGPLRKLISAPSFQFKGSGWYVTDYAKGTEKGGAASAPKDDAKSEVSTDTKPVAAGGDSGAAADKKSDKRSDKPAEKASSPTSGSTSPSSSSDS